MRLYITYEEHGDLLAVWFRDGASDAAGHDMGGHRFLETDADGPVSVEFLFASDGIDLTDVPHAEEIEQALGKLHELTGKVRRKASA